MATTLKVEAAADNKAATFILENEDHTLGNSLRYIIGKNPETAFVGYSIPHPAEKVMNIGVQTNNASAHAVFEEGLHNLIDLCQHVGQVFEERCDDANVE